MSCIRGVVSHLLSHVVTSFLFEGLLMHSCLSTL